jgi:hypothetical protein
VRSMAATTSASVDIVPISEHLKTSADDVDDPLPDERVLKTGWLSKKGRRGVHLSMNIR